MKNHTIFGILLIALGLYAYHNADTGEGFLGLTNSPIPGLALIATGVLVAIGAF
jgi:hypothetical protein